jgi:hypothetical protein
MVLFQERDIEALVAHYDDKLAKTIEYWIGTFARYTNPSGNIALASSQPRTQVFTQTLYLPIGPQQRKCMCIAASVLLPRTYRKF